MNEEESIMPKHIAIIMDGNRRWARNKHMPIKLGHLKGVEGLKKIVRHCKTRNIPYLTVYAFSTENWKRDQQEVNDLMEIFYHYIQELIKDGDKDICIKILGDITPFNEKLKKGFMEVQENTKNNTKITFNLCLNYSGRSDLLQAIQNIANKAKQGELLPETISIETIANHLYTKDIPDPDLVIRTSGELRLSDFLTFNISYSELYFTDKYWPDFKPDDLDKAIEEFSHRQRRFGN